MEFSLSDSSGKRKMLMFIPEDAHLVTNGCEISHESKYMIDREGKIYIFLETINAAVESEHSFACDDNGEQIVFSTSNAKRLPILSMEEAIERLHSIQT